MVRIRKCRYFIDVTGLDPLYLRRLAGGGGGVPVL